MSSLNDKATVDEIITANGKHGITYIIEYKNIFDGRPTWKLCKDVYEYDHAMNLRLPACPHLKADTQACQCTSTQTNSVRSSSNK